jgi:putative ABC transport system permease protein
LITPEENFRYLVVKTGPGHANLIADHLQTAWKKTSPDDPYKGFMQNEVFDNFINSNRANNKVIYFISGVAVLLVGMGLYGLVSYNLTRRLKEFSVRKVFGASVHQIFGLMNRDYLWIVLISFVLGAPFGAYLMNLMLTAAYPETIPISPWPYVIAITVMISTVCLTVLSQLRRITHENPTETLRID